jgi:hypothetical protein
MPMMVLLAAVVLHVVAGAAIASGSAFALGKAAQWSIWLEAIRRFGVALYLASIASGLATIITVLRFQAIGIRELPERAYDPLSAQAGEETRGPASWAPSAVHRRHGHADVATHSRSIGRNEPAPPVATRIAGPTCQAWTPRYLAIWAWSEASLSAPTWMLAISPPGRTNSVVGMPVDPVAAKKAPCASTPAG